MVDAETDESLVDAFWSVARQLRGVSRDGPTPRGITPATARGLQVLLRHGPMRPGQLSRHLRIAPRSATEVVDDLAGLGLLTRAPDPTDRRATVLEATPEGRRLGAELAELRRHQSEQMFAALSVTDRAHLARILRKLAD